MYSLSFLLATNVQGVNVELPDTKNVSTLPLSPEIRRETRRSRRGWLETDRNPFTTLSGKWKFLEQFARLARRFIPCRSYSRQSPEKNFAKVWLSLRYDATPRDWTTWFQFSFNEYRCRWNVFFFFFLLRASFRSIDFSSFSCLRSSIVRQKLKLFLVRALVLRLSGMFHLPTWKMYFPIYHVCRSHNLHFHALNDWEKAAIIQ